MVHGPSEESVSRSLSGFQLVRMMGFSFDAMPMSTHGSAFGVRYVRLDEPNGGQLYVTEYGWRFLDHILPEKWYLDKQYLKAGKKLPRATSAVYRVPTFDRRNRRTDLVIRFSRLAQDVPLMLTKDVEKEVAPEDRYQARFNGPFEEFGRIFELKKEPGRPDLPRILTKRPLGIYSPGTQQAVWRMGRHKSQFSFYRRELEKQQPADTPHAMFELDIKRDYVMIYQWIKGIDAEIACVAGLLTEEQLAKLTRRVNHELMQRGFKVLDNKPRHFIVRVSPETGEVLRRHGKIVYALIDFELLQRV